MIHDIDNLENLPPDQAKYMLAETKLKLMNLMSHLEFLESRIANRERVSQDIQTFPPQLTAELLNSNVKNPRSAWQ